MMKRFLIAAALCVAASAPAYPQAGQFPAGTVEGNASSAKRQALPETVTAILDRALGTTRGAIIERGASGWGLIGPGTTGLAFVSNGAGADPAYQVLGIAGGGTNCAAASGTCLDNITGFASTGIMVRTGAGAYAFISPTRAGDITYWNGSAWVTLAGNNSGTNFLQETPAGVPSWVAAPGTGTVTSVGIVNTYGLSISGSPVTSNGNISAGVSLTSSANSIASDVAMNNTATYFDGPSVAQGTSGAWLATGQATVTDTAGVAVIDCKLWDGTTVIDSAAQSISAASQLEVVHLSGVLASPAANLRISCKDISSTSGIIRFNSSGNSKDSTLTVVRIQ